MRSWGDFAI